MFVGIFGIDAKKKTLKEISVITCEVHGMTRAILSEIFSYFHFFFIPLFKWNHDYRLTLRCGCVYFLSKEQAKDIINGEDYDLHTLTKLHNGGFDGYKHCRLCNKNFDTSYVYCPFCGDELERN